MIARIRRFIAFWWDQGTPGAARLIRRKLGEIVGVNGKPGETSDPKMTLPELWALKFVSQQPLHTYVIPKSSLPRISLVTDSIGSGSLFGGVGTALLFAAQLANRMNATLRIVTRTEEPSPANASQVLDAYGIRLRQEIQFAFAPHVGGDYPSALPAGETAPSLDILPDEIFVTTSWWTTAAALPSVPPASIVYLLQEDERMFYPFGEERVQCERVLQVQDIRFVVNTQLLYDHLIATGLDHLRRAGCWFEPAFPKSLFHEREREPGGKKRFFFYARPNNSRNLFHIGLDLIDRAVNEEILDLAQWDIFLVGKDIPNVTFGDGYSPHAHRRTRLGGLCRPGGNDRSRALPDVHAATPAYPPLDLAASGAVVVTNKFANKQDLSGYSRNILAAELNTQAMLDALRAGVALAGDKEARSRNFAANALGSDWTQSFESTLESLSTGR